MYDWSHKLVVGNVNKSLTLLEFTCNKIDINIKNSFVEDSCIKCDYKSQHTKYDKIYNQNNTLNKL